MENSPTLLVGLIGMVTSLVGVIIWIVKRFLEVTIPEQQKLFQEQIAKERETFEKIRDKDRDLVLTIHRDMTAELHELGQAVAANQEVLEQNQRSLEQLLTSPATSSESHHVATVLRSALAQHGADDGARE